MQGLSLAAQVSVDLSALLYFWPSVNIATQRRTQEQDCNHITRRLTMDDVLRVLRLEQSGSAAQVLWPSSGLLLSKSLDSDLVWLWLLLAWVVVAFPSYRTHILLLILSQNILWPSYPVIRLKSDLNRMLSRLELSFTHHLLFNYFILCLKYKFFLNFFYFLSIICFPLHNKVSLAYPFRNPC